MNKFLVEFKKELYYQWFSKMIITSLIVIIILSILNIFSLNNSIVNKYNLYTKTLKFYKEDGLDIEKALSKDYKVKSNSNIDDVNNLLKHYYDAISNSIEAINPINTINRSLSFLTFAFLPIIWGVYGAIVGSYDFKYKTLKVRSVLSKNKNFLLSKHFSISIVIVLNTLISLLVFYILSLILYNIILHNNTLKNFITLSKFNIWNNILKVLFSVTVSIIFSNIGLIIGIISKNSLLASLIICLYNLLIPNLGEYDIKNLIMNLGDKIYTFNESFQ